MGEPIYPYVKSAALFHCPDDPTTMAVNTDGYGETDFPISYGINVNVTIGVTVSLLTSPPNTVLMFETQGTQSDITTAAHEAPLVGYQNAPDDISPAGDGGDATGTTYGYLDYTPPAKYVCGQSATLGMGNPARPVAGVLGAPRHFGGANFAMCDGHVSFIVPQRVSPGKTATTSQPTDQDSPSAGYAASTNYMGYAPENFKATFSIL